MAKVGFNHRFHPAISELAAEVHSGRHGELMHLRARYGHGGRVGYDREWRAQPARSGGGELIDQGMHLLDLTHWIAGPLPLHSALLRTQFWDTEVEDNAALILGAADDRRAPWAMLHVTWTEWKNTFSIEVYCRTAKLQVDGLVRSYGPQKLRIYRMRPELGPPDLEERTYPDEDQSWTAEWEHTAGAIASGGPVLGEPPGRPLCVVEGRGCLSGFAGVRGTGNGSEGLAHDFDGPHGASDRGRNSYTPRCLGRLLRFGESLSGPRGGRAVSETTTKWPKVLRELTPEEQAVHDDFMRRWHEVLPRRYGVVERFNH